MAQTTLPVSPTKSSSVERQVWAVWEALLYFLKSVYDTFVSSFVMGSNTVLNGTTTVVVTHSLGRASYAVLLSPTIDPGGKYWVSTKTASQFTINLQNAAPVSGVSFDWMVKAV